MLPFLVLLVLAAPTTGQPSFLPSPEHVEEDLCPPDFPIPHHLQKLIDSLLRTHYPTDQLWTLLEVESDMIDGVGHSGEAGLSTAERGEGSTTTTKRRAASTYGEITTEGGRHLFAAMGLYDLGLSPNDDDTGTTEEAANGKRVFYDLGSGSGKLVVQCFLELHPTERIGAVGIELSQTRHDIALKNWNEVRNHVSSDEDLKQEFDFASWRMDPELSHDSFLTADLSGATHIFVASLCMDDEILEKLVTRLEEIPDLEVMASMRPLSMDGARWDKPKVVYVETTWSKGQRVLVYRRVK